MDYLCVVNNVSAGMLSHPLDESRTKEMFKFLHSIGVELELQAIRNWAVEKKMGESKCERAYGFSR
ncbi:hypothetical protein [Enterobacter ludwigii]